MPRSGGRGRKLVQRSFEWMPSRVCRRVGRLSLDWRAKLRHALRQVYFSMKTESIKNKEGQWRRWWSSRLVQMRTGLHAMENPPSRSVDSSPLHVGSSPPHAGESLVARAVGAVVISPAFQRGVGATNNTPESRRDGAHLVGLYRLRKIDQSKVLYQGTTSVGPQMSQNEGRALQAAEKLNPEGDGGFNPHVKPIE